MSDITEMNQSINNGNLTLGDYINIFKRNKKKILIITLSVGIITTLLVFLVINPIFLSTGIVKTTAKSSGLGGLLSGTGLPEIGDFADLGGGGDVAKELALYETILYSRRCVEETIIKFNIMEEEHFKYMYDAVKYFRANIMEVSKDKIAGVITIGVFDKNPERAKEIADFLIFQLNKINTELNIQNAKNNREFIENRYNLVKDNLTRVEDSLKRFQDNFGIAPELLAQSAVKAQIELEAQIKSEEVKLDLMRKILSPDQAEIKSQEELLSALRKQLFEIENSSDIYNNLNLKGKPDIILNYLRIKRDVEIQNKILSTLIPLLEQSKIEENRQTPSILLIDQPNVPDKKSKPKRSLIILFSLAVTFVIVYLYYFLKFYFRNKITIENN